MKTASPHPRHQGLLALAICLATQPAGLTASDGAGGSGFGESVSLDGGKFVINALGRGKACSGSIASVTTLDTGNPSKTVSGLRPAAERKISITHFHGQAQLILLSTLQCSAGLSR